MTEEVKSHILVMWDNEQPPSYCILQADSIVDGELRRCPENALNMKIWLYLEYELLEGLVIFVGSLEHCKIKYEQYSAMNKVPIEVSTELSPVITIQEGHCTELSRCEGEQLAKRDAIEYDPLVIEMKSVNVKMDIGNGTSDPSDWQEREASLIAEIGRLKEKCSRLKEEKKKWKRMYKECMGENPVELFPGSSVALPSDELQKLFTTYAERPNTLGRALLKRIFDRNELIGRSLYGSGCNANKSVPLPEIDPTRRDAIIGCVLNQQGFDYRHPPTKDDEGYHKFAGIRKSLRNSLQCFMNHLQRNRSKQLSSNKPA